MYVMYSDDHGQTWETGAETYQTSAVRPNETFAVELVDGRIYFNSRDTIRAQNGYRSINYSNDGGESFIGPSVKETAIPTPASQNSALRFRSLNEGDPNNVILYASPGDPENGYRVNLMIHTSYDETATWTQETLIHSGRAAYTDLVKLSQNRFGVLFETGLDDYYEAIMFARVDFADLSPLGWNGLVGDLNQDGMLTTADVDQFLLHWRANTSNLSQAEKMQRGDLDFNGVTDMDDAYMLRVALKNAAVSLAGLDSLMVPEPTAVVMLGLAMLMIWGRGRVVGNGAAQGPGPARLTRGVALGLALVGVALHATYAVASLPGVPRSFLTRATM